MQELEKKSRRIGRALTVTVALCFVTLLASTITLVGLSRTAVRTDEWIAQTLDVKEALDKLLTAVADAEAGQRGYLITGSEQFLKPVDAVDGLVEAQLANLRALLASNAHQKERLVELEPLIAERLAAIDETLELASREDRERIARVIEDRGAPAMARMRERILAMDASETALLIKRRNDFRIIREQFVAALAGFVVIAGVFAVFALLSVRAYIKELDRSRQRVAAHHAELEDLVAERTGELLRAAELAERERTRAETLLTDVNHRVGNNLALVSSFLTMQQRAVKNPEAAKALGAARIRVQAVASAHRKLRLGADFASVRANEVLGAVLDDIVAGLPSDGRIRIEQDLSSIEIHARDAVSLGVLTSELVMNAIKHGLPGSESGDIRAVFGLDGQGIPFLQVSDDGVGYENKNGDATPAGDGGLGARIIDMLARQFGGQAIRAPLRDGTRPGTSIRIALPKLELMPSA